MAITSRLELEKLMDAVPLGMIVMDENGRIRQVNHRAEALFGYPAKELLSMTVDLLLPQRYREMHALHRQVFFLQPRTRLMGQGGELFALHKDGHEIPVDVGLGYLESGGEKFVCAVILDLEAHKQAESQRDRFFYLSNEFFCIANLNATPLQVNPALTRALGWSQEEMLTTSWLDHVHRDDISMVKAAMADLAGGREVMGLKLRFHRKDGSIIHISWNIFPAPGLDLVYSAGRDISRQVKREDEQIKLIAELERTREKLRNLSNKDPLTGLANRRLFEKAYKAEWRRAKRAGESLALLMADIDNFKIYNDTYGHQAGDECLRQVARAMARMGRREGDLVARYGGEEFVVVLPNTDLAGARALAAEMRLAVEKLGLKHKNSPTLPVVTVSVGATAGRVAEGITPEEALAAADECLYQAKGAGRNRVCSRPFKPA